MDNIGPPPCAESSLHGAARRAWTQGLGALLRAVGLAAGAIFAVELWQGPALYLGILAVSFLFFGLPAYASARQSDVLRQLSLTDSLTGIGNRCALRIRLQQESARCARGRYEVAVLMIDVDKLKEINDEGGHRAGDEALQRVASALSRSVRISDVVGRYGGDEFLVIAPQTNARDACALAERIAQATRKETRRGRSVGLSIGVATTFLAGPNARDLLDSADVAMYEAKEQGGDCVVGPGTKRLSNVVPLRSRQPIGGRTVIH